MINENHTIAVLMANVISDRFARAFLPTRTKNSQKQSMMYTDVCCIVSAKTVGTGRI